MSYIPLKDLSDVSESSTQLDSASHSYPSANGEFQSDNRAQSAQVATGDVESNLNFGTTEDVSLADMDGDEVEEYISEEEHLKLVKSFRVYIWLLVFTLFTQTLVFILSTLYLALGKPASQRSAFFVASCLINVFGALFLFFQHYYLWKPWIGGRKIITLGAFFFVVVYNINAVLSVASGAKLVTLFLIFGIVLSEIGFYVIMRVPNGRRVGGPYLIV